MKYFTFHSVFMRFNCPHISVQGTLFGQSAGAQSTMIHLMEDHSDKYFRAAIIEMPCGIPLKNTKEALVIGRELSALLDCGTLVANMGLSEK